MFHRTAQALVALSLVLCPTLLSAQATPPQFFVVCASQANQPTIYFSGVLQGPATAIQPFRFAFTQFLMQQYSYQGVVACAPTNTAVNAQNFINQRTTAFRNAKKNVVDTNWTESAAAAIASVANAHPNPVPVAPPPAQVVQAQAVAATTATSSTAAPSAGTATSAPGAQVTSIINSIFGSPAGANTAGASSAASGAKTTQAKATTGQTASAMAVTESPASEVSSTLTSLFGKKSSKPNGGGSATQAGQPAAPGAASGQAAPKNAQNNLPPGALGAATSGTTQLLVYGCGRQDTQVACVTELTNENTKDTLVQSANVWKDAFIVDDRGDRHLRASGFFLNIDGDQRDQLDISYGKTARFILMFKDVQTKVQTVALRSTTGGLDVEQIALIAANAASGGNSAGTGASPGAADTASTPATTNTTAVQVQH